MENPSRSSPWIRISVLTEDTSKAHLGDIEESYLHNQGFDEALFTPMNQIVSQWNRTGDAVGAAVVHRYVQRRFD